jgi:DNA-binding transcriptional regulator YhcF (GntR family)
MPTTKPGLRFPAQPGKDGVMTPASIPDLDIDSASAVAPYEQIRTQLAARIADGSIVAGTRLPTVRTLAVQLGVAVNTVARSYRELEAAGLVETGGRAGTIVSAAGSELRERLMSAAGRYAALAISVGADRREAMEMVAAAFDAAG